MTRPKEFDIVELTEDLPEYGLTRGMHCVLVEVFDNPVAYDLQYVDKNTGRGTLAYGIKPGQVELRGWR